VIEVVAVNMVQVAEPVIPEVHARKISEAHAVPWDERLAKSQRAPSESTAEADSESKAAAEPSN
jgi:hypothetical protein